MTRLELIVLADTWGWHHDDAGIGWWFVMMLGMVVFWGAVIAFVVWLLRGGLERRGEPPEETLRRRLADGSISVEEYEQRRAAMHSSTREGSEPVGPPEPGPG